MNGVKPIGSIVIPAHNEGRVIGACLDQIQHAVRTGRYELVVVSNGSNDGTANKARVKLAEAPLAHIIELSAASKIEALRAGDRQASVYPRLYLDADISVDEATVDCLFSELSARAGPAVGAPTLRVDTTGCSWAVRAYHRVWRQLPYVASGVIGTGMYAVNRAGGERMGTFPDVLNDDEWVRRTFLDDEKVTSAGSFVARAPRTARALVRQRARIEIGNHDLAATIGTSARLTSVHDLSAVAKSSTGSFVDVVAYTAVILSVRALAAWRRVRGTAALWSTDLSSRALAPDGRASTP